MAMMSVLFWEEKEPLPVEITTEDFSFGEIVYLRVGNYNTADHVVLHLSPEQLDRLAAGIAKHKKNSAPIEADKIPATSITQEGVA